MVDETHGVFPVHVAEQVADQRGLAGADIPADDRKAGLVYQSVLKQGERHAVLVAQKEKTRIRQQRERLFPQLVERLVHGVGNCLAQDVFDSALFSTVPTILMLLRSSTARSTSCFRVRPSSITSRAAST